MAGAHAGQGRNSNIVVGVFSLFNRFVGSDITLTYCLFITYNAFNRGFYFIDDDMIKYQLICDKLHEFEGWFQTSAAFEEQSRSKLIRCPVCDSGNVRRALMTPSLSAQASSCEQCYSA